jgi:hypothetical protein
MARTNNVDPNTRLQTSTRMPIFIPERDQDPKGTHRKLQGGRRGYMTRGHQLVIGQLVENGGTGGKPWREIMANAGYSPSVQENPAKVTQALGFLEMLEEALPDAELHEVHKGLLLSKKLDHMTFPLGPRDEDDPNFSGSTPNSDNAIEKAGMHVERTTLTDGEIKDLIASVGGTVRRVVHGDTARHVYFWAPNATARQAALKLAYELKGHIGKSREDGSGVGSTYNTFIQQNNFDPNTPDAKKLVETTLDSLMEQTRARVPADA